MLWRRWSSSLQAWACGRSRESKTIFTITWCSGLRDWRTAPRVDRRRAHPAGASGGELRLARRRSRRHACCMFGIGAAAGFQDLRVIVSRSFRPRIEQLSVRRLADAIVPAFETNRVKRPLVTIDQPVVGHCRRRPPAASEAAHPLPVDEGWSFMFGEPTRPLGRPIRGEHVDLCGSRAGGASRRPAWPRGPRAEGRRVDNRRPKSALTALAAPGLEQIVQRFLERNLSPPAELGSNPRRIPDDDRLIVRAVPRWIVDDLDRHAGPRQQHVEHFADGDRPSRADVVRAAGLAALGDGLVGANGVAHVGQIAARVQIADLNLRLPAARLDIRNASREP